MYEEKRPCVCEENHKIHRKYRVEGSPHTLPCSTFVLSCLSFGLANDDMTRKFPNNDKRKQCLLLAGPPLVLLLPPDYILKFSRYPIEWEFKVGIEGLLCTY